MNTNNGIGTNSYPVLSEEDNSSLQPPIESSIPKIEDMPILTPLTISTVPPPPMASPSDPGSPTESVPTPTDTLVDSKSNPPSPVMGDGITIHMGDKEIKDIPDTIRMSFISQIKNIYNTFIQSGAPLEINIAHATALIIGNRIQSKRYSDDIFDSAKSEIEMLLTTNTIPKFIQYLKKTSPQV